MTKVAGTDPGKTGAIAMIDTDGWTLSVVDMPREAGMANREAVSPTMVAQVFQKFAPDYSFCEDVWSSPQAGVSSSFSFGRSLGIILGASASRSMLTLVRPTVWKSATQTPRDKNQARRRAQELFPCAAHLFARVRDDGRSEACLIAFYGLLSLRLTPPRLLTLREIP